MKMGEERRRGYNDFSLRMSSSLSKDGCVCCRKPILGFSLWMTFSTFMGNEGIYSMGEGYESHT